MQCRAWTKKNFIEHLIAPVCPDYDCLGNPLSPYDQEEILTLHHLYQFEGFRLMIEDFSGYKEYIKKLGKKLVCSGFAQEMRKLPGFKNKKFDAIIHELDQKITAHAQHAAQQWQEEKQKTIRQQFKMLHYQSSTRATMQALTHEYAQQLSGSAESDYCGSLYWHLDDRIQAIEDTYGKDFSITSASYALSSQAHAVLQNHRIDAQVFSYCSGSPLQLQLQKELVEILIACATPSSHLHQPDHLVDFLDVAREYIQAGLVAKAIQWTDFCWAFFDYTHAVGQGVCDGVTSTANMLLHPVDTAYGIGSGIAQAGYSFGCLVSQLIDINVTLLSDTQSGLDKYDQLIAQCEAVYNAIRKKINAMPTRDCIRAVTALATEGFLIGKALGACEKLYQVATTELIVARPVIKELINKPFVPYTDMVDNILVYVAHQEFLLADVLVHHSAPIAGVVTESIDTMVHIQKSSNLNPMSSEIAHMPRYGDSIQAVEKTFTKLMGSQKARELVPYSVLEDIQKMGNSVELIIHPAPNQKWKVITNALALPQEIDELMQSKKLLSVDLLYQDYCPFEEIELTHKACYHAFGIEIGREIKQDGQILEFLSGFHNDMDGILEANGICTVEKIENLGKGIYKTDIACKYVKNKVFRVQTLFDNTVWTRKNIIEALESSLKNLCKQPDQASNGRWTFTGKIADNITMITVTDSNGKIITFYPM